MINPNCDKTNVKNSLTVKYEVDYVRGNAVPLASEPMDHLSPIRGESALWQAVITQALMDASCRSEKVEAKHSRREALAWLRGTSQDFITVCLFAGLDPDWVREQAHAAMDRGFRWRAEPSETAAYAHSHLRAITNPRTLMAVAPTTV